MYSNLLLHQYQPLYMLILVYQLMYLEVLLTNHRMERQPRDSPRESSLGRNPLGGPPFNPPIGSYE
jgi:hypothetical protein